MIELLEREQRDRPFCDCGAVTVPLAREGALWLESSSLGVRKPVLQKLLSLDFDVAHTRRHITDLFDLRPVAI